MKTYLLIPLVMTLTACANLNSVHRRNPIHHSGQTEMVDAKQRAIIISPNLEYEYANGVGRDGEPTLINSRRLYNICSEPSPDVFSAYATAIAAKGSKGATDLGAELGLSSSEVASSIERTQVINMLRESMFRTCERYLNGALNSEQMGVQTARDQRMMIATLAIEQLTGIVKTKPTIISAGAVSVMTDSVKDLLDKLEAAEKAKETAQTELAAAETAQTQTKAVFVELNKTSKPEDEKGACDILLTASESSSAETLAGEYPSADSAEDKADDDVAAGEGAPAETEGASTEAAAQLSNEQLATQNAKKSACEKAKNDQEDAATNVTLAKAKLDAAKSKEDTIKSVIQKFSGLALTASAEGAAGSAVNNNADTARITAVAGVVKDITLLAFSDRSELGFACVTALQNGANSALQEICAQFYANEIKRSQAIDKVVIEGAHYNKAFEANDDYLNEANVSRVRSLRQKIRALAPGQAKALLLNPAVPMSSTEKSRLDRNFHGDLWVMRHDLNDASAKALLEIHIANLDSLSADVLDAWDHELSR